MKRMLSNPGAAATVLSLEGQPPFRSHCHPVSPSSTRSTSRRAPPTAAGTMAGTESPVGRGAQEPWDLRPP